MSEPRKPLVVIGVPCFHGVTPEILHDWMLWAFHLGRRVTGYDFQLAIRSKSEQFRARNSIVDAARQVNADWLVMLDDDMIIDPDKHLGPNDNYRWLERLLHHDKDIVGALYFQRMGECRPVAMVEQGERGYRFLFDGEVQHKLQRVDVVGGGAMLVRMKVFDFIPQPFFSAEHEYGTDVQLCRAAKAAGFEVWLDSSIELGHVREERVTITSRNKAQYAVSDLPGEVREFIHAEVYERLIQDAENWTGFNRAEFSKVGQAFMEERRKWMGSDADWYAQYPKERVARQVWFNTESPHKRKITEYLLNLIGAEKRTLDILDFGCGIGIPAFTFAEKGHRVTATDLGNTGTYLFLQWRSKFHNVPIEFRVAGEMWAVAEENSKDVVVAMDCLEHIPNWRQMLAELAAILKPGGILFANNAVLDDTNHPEHYDLKPADFVAACAEFGLMPINQLVYAKTGAQNAAA